MESLGISEPQFPDLKNENNNSYLRVLGSVNKTIHTTHPKRCLARGGCSMSDKKVLVSSTLVLPFSPTLFSSSIYTALTYSPPSAILSPADLAVSMVGACSHGVFYILPEKSEKKKKKQIINKKM